MKCILDYNYIGSSKIVFLRVGDNQIVKGNFFQNSNAVLFGPQF